MGCTGKAPLQRSALTEDLRLNLPDWLVVWDVRSLWSCCPLHNSTLTLYPCLLLQPASPSALLSFALTPFWEACSSPFPGRPLWCCLSEVKSVAMYSGPFSIIFSRIWVLAPSSQNVVQLLLNSIFYRHPVCVSHTFMSLFPNELKHSSYFHTSGTKTFFPFPCLRVIFSVASTY